MAHKRVGNESLFLLLLRARRHAGVSCILKLRKTLSLKLLFDFSSELVDVEQFAQFLLSLLGMDFVVEVDVIEKQFDDLVNVLAGTQQSFRADGHAARGTHAEVAHLVRDAAIAKAVQTALDCIWVVEDVVANGASQLGLELLDRNKLFACLFVNRPRTTYHLQKV